MRSRFLAVLVCALTVGAAGAEDIPAPVPAPAPAALGLGPAAPPRSERPDFVFLPNGAGATPDAALRDLDRIMAAYEKKPGFHRYAYYKIVQISKNQYQADGMCTWDAPDAKRPPADPRKSK
jgi:hypothetical protein